MITPHNGNFGWVGIFRLGLIQTALGSIVVLTTSTLNRVMVVELALAAMLPGVLVGLHSALQVSRPMWGHASDGGRRRSPWIAGGMIILAGAGVLAAKATAIMSEQLELGIAVAVVAYLLIGVGVGAAGTNLLALLAARVDADRKAPAAAMVWIMMIAGFIVTTATAGALLKPFSFDRLVEVTAWVSAAALLVTFVALFRLEGRAMVQTHASDAPRTPFVEALKEVMKDREAATFTVFVFVSMLAYNTQDLILEPFAGAVFSLSPGDSTQLTSVQHSGVLFGMILVACLAGRMRWSALRPLARLLEVFGLRSTKRWAVVGCVASGLLLFALAASGFMTEDPEVLRGLVGGLGFANGAFAVAAIGWMMGLASKGGGGKEGIRMGLWGGAQAIAFALGGFVGTMGVDIFRYTQNSPIVPYAAVFVVEGAMFLVAAGLASRLGATRSGLSASDLVAATLSPDEASPGPLAGTARELSA